MGTLAQHEFDVIAGFLKTRSGLSINYDKLYLLENRLQTVLKAHGMATLLELVKKLSGSTITAELATDIVEAMTTNESMFFRDQKPFYYMRDHLLPELAEQGKTDLRIWSAACSHGQEPYSIAMLLRDAAAKLEGMRVEILATEIASKVMERARTGIYTQFEVQRGLPIQMLMKYFEQTGNNQWQVKEMVRDMVRFRLVNLLDEFDGMGPFDIVMCRNVLIYFDEPTKVKILARIADVMHPGARLFLGASETILNQGDSAFITVSGCPGMFERK